MRRRRLRAGGALLVAALAAGVLLGCAPAAPLHVTATPGDAYFDSTIRVRVTGADPGSDVSVRFESRSHDGSTWSSRAVFRAGSTGVITNAQAPRSGDYRGVRVRGLMEAVHPPSPASAHPFFEVASPWRIRITASADGRTSAWTTITRTDCDQVARVTDLTLAHDGVEGVLVEPLHPATSAQPAVVVAGGSEGGLAVGAQACSLAAHGYPALALAYFHESGLPDTLTRIPLEYFATAARLLAAAPHVDARRIVLWGDSRGSEAALLTASDYPSLVYGVVATMPSSVANGSLPPGHAAWTLGGAPVSTSTSGAAVDAGPGVIPVERIAGPLFLVCGGLDDVWQSCGYAAAIEKRLTDTHASNAVTLKTYPAAGHFAGELLAGYPMGALQLTVPDGSTVTSGGTALANAEAQDDGWTALLSWLAELRRS